MIFRLLLKFMRQITVNNHVLGCLATAIMLSALFFSAPTQAQTETVHVYSRTYDPVVVQPTAVLDSWMEPVVSRKREIIKENGERESIVEPLVMERHERVLAPIGEITTVTSTKYAGRTVKVAENISSRKIAQIKPKRHFRPRKTVAAKAKHRYVAKRTVVETTPVVVERTERTEHRSMIVERRDPALLIY